MVKILAVVLLAVLYACSITIPIDEDSANRRVKANADQHMAVGVLAALFYCENRRWPESLHELRGFRNLKKISLPAAIDWEWLSRPGVEFVSREQIILQTPGGHAAGDVAVSSLHSTPGCDGNNINPRIHLNF